MSFKNLNLSKPVMRAIEDLGFEKPTPIQSNCIPLVLDGKDVVGRSLTGSGKTAAFILPLLNMVEESKGQQVIVLAPVRELAHQVKDAFDEFSKHTKLSAVAVYGGVSLEPQVKALRKSEFIIATPGRLLDHMQRGNIDTKNIKHFVLDEADKMFDMGFIDDIKKIITQLPKSKQTLLFSATMPSQVKKLVSKYLTNPEIIEEEAHVDKGKLTQVYYDVKQNQKFALLVHLLKHKTDGLAIVFCSRRNEVDVVGKNLKKQNISAMAIHGGLTQNRRSKALGQLKDGKIDVLVATEVAARGLDVKNISSVINYDSATNPQEYTHRIGRTARAGTEGIAITLLTPRDHEAFSSVMADSQINIEKRQVPELEKVEFTRNSYTKKGDRGNNSRGSGNRYGGRGRNSNQGSGRGSSGGRGNGRGSNRARSQKKDWAS